MKAVGLSAALLLGLTVASAESAHAAGYTYSDLVVTGASTTIGRSVNDAGQLTGYFVDGTGYHGFVETNGVFTILNAPGNPIGTIAWDINNSGQVVGWFNDAVGSHGFIETAGSYVTLDDPLAKAGTTRAAGLNDFGQVVGTYGDSSGIQHGFLEQSGNYVTIDDPLATAGTSPQGINDAGEIGGTYSITGSDQSFTDVKGVFTTVSDLPYQNVHGVTNSGQLVGDYYSGGFHGFIDSGSSYVTIDDPLAVHSMTSVYTGTIIYKANLSGEVTGYYYDASGNTQGFLATPIPEPAGLAVLGVGLLGVVSVRYRRASRACR